MKAFAPIQTDSAPKAIGCYSQAVSVSDWIFLSGQIGLQPDSQLLLEGFEAQCHQIFKNIEQVLLAGGANFNHIVKLTIFIVDLTHFSVLNEIMKKYISEPYPARAVVGVHSLPKGAMIEIEALAAKFIN